MTIVNSNSVTPSDIDAQTPPDHDDRPLNIEDVRREIDSVDKALLGLIAKRLELAAAVRKAKSGISLWRPSREESHVRELAAAIADTPTRLVSNIWAELMSSSIALQGQMQLYISLEDDGIDIRNLVRDRFGAALPLLSYPTTSSALAAAYASQEGVAVLPAPAMMQNWWTALCPSGAMPDMKIQAALPRTGRRDWPLAVAVATAQLQPSGDDETLIAIAKSAPKSALDHASAEHGAQLRAETKTQILLSLPNYYDHSPIDQGAIIGCLPRPLG